MTNDKLERVARAIHAADGTWNDLRWSDLPAGARRKFREYAAAAIAACEAEAGEREREGSGTYFQAMKAATDEIERLREALAEIREVVRHRPFPITNQVFEMADAALNTTAGEGSSK